MVLPKYSIIFLLFLAWYQRNVSQFLTILKDNKSQCQLREKERERERERVIRVCSTTLEELGENLGGSFFIFKYELNNIYSIFLFKIYFSCFLRSKITNQVFVFKFL